MPAMCRDFRHMEALSQETLGEAVGLRLLQVSSAFRCRSSDHRRWPPIKRNDRMSRFLSEAVGAPLNATTVSRTAVIAVH
jgi:hypothetical protein